MATTQPDAPNPLQDKIVVDCDVHISRSDTIKRRKMEYLDEPYRSWIDPDTETNAYGASTYEQSIPATGMTADRNDNMDIDDLTRDVAELLCEQEGVTHPIVNMAGGQDSIPDTKRALAEVRADNHVLIDMLADEPEFFGAIDVLTREPHKSAEIIDDFASEEQITGVYISTASVDRPVGVPANDPIFEAAEDNGLTMMYHGGSGPRRRYTPYFDTAETYLEIHPVSHPLQQMITLTTLIGQGVPVKYPDLNHVFLESSLGWIPYLMHRMNREYRQRPADAPLLEKTPEEYIREYCWFDSQPIEEPIDTRQITNMIELVGPENVVFGSDHPHFDFDNPAAVDKHYRRFSDEERDAMLHGNAIEAFDLPISV